MRFNEHQDPDGEGADRAYHEDRDKAQERAGARATLQAELDERAAVGAKWQEPACCPHDGCPFMVDYIITEPGRALGECPDHGALTFPVVK